MNSGATLTSRRSFWRVGLRGMLLLFLLLGVILAIWKWNTREQPRPIRIYNDTPLVRAVESNDLSAARRLLEAGADPNAAYSVPLVQTCVENGHAEMLELLLENGAAVRRDSLNRAISGNHPTDIKLKLVRSFLEHGASADDIASAMQVAFQNTQAEVGRLLVEYGAEYTAREAAAFNDLDALKAMVAERPELVQARFPLRPGGSIEFGDSLAEIALERGHREIVAFLIDAGAPLDMRDDRGCTLLHWACMRGDLEIAQLLVERGFDVHARDNNQYTPLHSATNYMFNVEIVKLLVDAGADVNARDDHSITPLSGVLYMRDAQRGCELLLAAGADPNVPDLNGASALDKARQRGNPEIVTLLESYASPKEVSGDAPQSEAAARGVE